jgi:hypothetical protein
VQQRTIVIANARVHACRARNHDLPELDQPLHVRVDPSEVCARRPGVDRDREHVDVWREARAGLVVVVIAPRLDVGAGDGNGGWI